MIVSDNQYERIEPTPPGEKVYKQIAQAASSKVIFMSLRAAKLTDLAANQRPGFVEVAHELAHTIPKWLWSSRDMNGMNGMTFTNWAGWWLDDPRDSGNEFVNNRHN